MPMTPLGSSSSSPDMALSRPYTRAMPSPTCRTEPSSFSSVEPEKPSICFLMTAVISSGLMAMDGLPHAAQLAAQA